MDWQQLHLQCQKDQTELAEALLMHAGALSIILEDAGDQPLFEPMPGESPLWDEVILTAIFTQDTYNQADFETLGYDIASQTQASRVWISTLADKDWEREWMQYYQPIQCAYNLWIVPNWIAPPNPQAINIIMDPGLAFGTGYHATTRLCLDWLADLVHAKPDYLRDKIVVDYGAGSGILGIAALLLGAKQVYAVDIDPQAVLASRQNAERNGMGDCLVACLPNEFQQICQDQALLPIDMVLANILAKPLMSLAPYFADLLKVQGDIVLSGLIESQIEEVKSAYQPFFDMEEAFSFSQKDDQHWQRLSGKKRS